MKNLLKDQLREAKVYYKSQFEIKWLKTILDEIVPTADKVTV